MPPGNNDKKKHHLELSQLQFTVRDLLVDPSTNHKFGSKHAVSKLALKHTACGYGAQMNVNRLLSQTKDIIC